MHLMEGSAGSIRDSRCPRLREEGVEGDSPKQSRGTVTSRRVNTKIHLAVQSGPRQPPWAPQPAGRARPAGGNWRRDRAAQAGGRLRATSAALRRFSPPAAVELGYGASPWLRGSCNLRKPPRPRTGPSAAGQWRAAALRDPPAEPGLPAPTEAPPGRLLTPRPSSAPALSVREQHGRGPPFASASQAHVGARRRPGLTCRQPRSRPVGSCGNCSPLPRSHNPARPGLFFFLPFFFFFFC